MIYTIGIIASFLGGAFCMWMVCEVKNAPEQVYWHITGYISQWTRTYRAKITDDEIDIHISDN